MTTSGPRPSPRPAVPALRVNPVASGDKLVTLPRRAPRAPPRPNQINPLHVRMTLRLWLPERTSCANASSKPPQCRRWRVAWNPQARAFTRSSARQLHAPPAYRQNATPRRAPIHPRSCAEPQCRLCARTRRAIQADRTKLGTPACLPRRNPTRSSYSHPCTSAFIRGSPLLFPRPLTLDPCPLNQCANARRLRFGVPHPKALIQPGGAIVGIPR